MSVISVQDHPNKVKHYRKRIDRLTQPPPEEIPSLWRESVALESLAPVSLRGGLARARTRLLDTVPTWRLPEVLDSLTTEGTAI